jgi:hypothetical protein
VFRVEEQARVQIYVFEVMPAAFRVGEQGLEARVLSFVERAVAQLGQKFVQFNAHLRGHD